MHRHNWQFLFFSLKAELRAALGSVLGLGSHSEQDTLVDLVMPERGDSLVEAFNIWKEAGEDAACCDFALAVTVPQMDDQTRFTFIVIAITINVVTIITTSMKGRHGAVVQGAGRQLLQAVHVPEGPADA